jgi:hypothetical protein
MLAAVERPSPFEQTRMILARQRRMGEPFEVAFEKAVEVVAPVVNAYPKDYAAVDRDPTRSVLRSTRQEWRRGWERRPVL